VQVGEETDDRAGQHSPDDILHRQFSPALSLQPARFQFAIPVMASFRPAPRQRDCGCRTKSEALHLKRFCSS
jgi:hypothetical protein